MDQGSGGVVFPGRPALPEDHPYLQLLRGKFKDVDISIGRLSIQNGNQEAQAENDHLSEIENMLQALLEGWRQDWSMKMKDEDLRFPLDHRKGNTPDPYLKIICDGCSKRIDITHVCFTCTICRVGNDYFDLCENCALLGKRCGSPDHEPRLVRSEVAFNTLVRFQAKAIHSIPSKTKDGLLPSVDALKMPDSNLNAVIKAYAEQTIKTTNRDCPIGLHLHLFKGETMESLHGKLNGATSCIYKWRAICHFLTHDHFEPRIHHFLTPEHMDVIKLLLEWWIGDIQDTRLSQMALNGLFMTFTFQGTLPRDTASLMGTTRSNYQKALTNLFRLEFEADSSNPTVLRFHRAEASRQASVQRLGFSYLRGNMVPLWHKPAENMYRTAWMHLVSVSRSMRPCLSVCEKENFRETHRFAVEVLKAYHGSMDLAMADLRRAQTILGPKQLNASISPCGWIPQAEKLAHVPYYLWDKEGRQTVRTKDLRYLPEYTVVSHTWGRWKIKGSEDIELRNVPWKIPQNGRFSVSNLADILIGVPGCNRYVWFDLVCIPQSTNDMDLKAIEKQEIAKQAAIFSHAETAVAWLNTIDNFGPLEDICHMLAMNVLRYPGQLSENQLDECLENLSRLNKELMDEPLYTPLAQAGLKPKPNLMPWNEVLDEWFSSLWTLQEACMRPDMWLCTRSWESLKSHASGIPIPLDCVLSLIRVNSPILLGDKRPILYQGISTMQAL